MADDAVVTITATVLPDEIAKTITGSMTVAPDDTNDKWYYKLTACTTTSTDLIAGYFTDYTAVDDDTAPTAVHTADKVKFLFVQNQSTTASVYMVFDAGTASSSAGDGVTVGPSETFFARLPNATVADVHAISSTGTVTCIVAALLDDV